MDSQPVVSCYHCQTPVTDRGWWVEVGGEEKPVCCPGCQAAVQLIQGLSLDQFYQFRDNCGVDDSGIRPQPLDQSDLTLLAESVTIRGDVQTLHLVVPDIRCAACVWLLEEGISRLPEVTRCQVNLASKRLRVELEAEAAAEAVLRFVRQLGYHTVADRPHELEALVKRERRALLSRIGVAGIGMAQVMMYAFAVYLSGGEIDPSYEGLMKWAALIVATPVAMYSATPFYIAALNDLRRGLLGMDVPVSLAIVTAYCLSLYHTVNGFGEVYFDSVTMFTFFLLFGRFLESEAQEAFLISGNLAGHLLPRQARKVVQDQESPAAVNALVPGDLVRVMPGEVVPVDGVVRSGISSANEAAFTGEALPVIKQPGARMLAGSRNLESELLVEMDTPLEAFVLQKISDLHEEASAHKPRFSLLADRVARYFVLAVLLLAAAAGSFWALMGNDQALIIALTVLVVSCPCALSLATPVAYSFALTTLRGEGVLVRNGGLLERLSGISQVIFDKTGTLTQGELSLAGVETVGKMPVADVLEIAATLERHNKHPIAAAFALPSQKQVAGYESHIGEGVSGCVDGVPYRLGEPLWASSGSIQHRDEPGHWLLLFSDQALAWFKVEDRIRDEAAQVTRQMRAAGYTTALFTGDASMSLELLQARWDIHDIRVDMTPEDKVEGVRASQQQGNQVMMVGDGVNDAAAMGIAEVSVAVSPADYFVHNAADATLMGGRLSVLPALLAFGERVTRIIRQNVFWAVSYNMTAIPLAAAGLLEPWMAALGMSLSSLLVVMNARRLRTMPTRLEAS